MKAEDISLKAAGLLTSALAAALLLSACHSSRGSLSTATRVAAPAASSSAPASSAAVRHPEGGTFGSAATNPLLEEARSWLGVPYVFGGNDRQGVDCSGLTTQVFLNAMDVRLPRTSAEQRLFCPDSIGRGALEPGDLVFFDTTRERLGNVSHVGLYIGGGDMIHSSTSRGVTVTSIDSDYYAARFLGGGRVGGVKAASAEAPAAAPVRKAEAKAAKKAAQGGAVDDRALVISRLIEEKIDSIYGSN